MAEQTAAGAAASTATEQLGAETVADPSQAPAVGTEAGEQLPAETPELSEEDVPTSYFGRDLSHLDAAGRKAVIDVLKGNERYTQKVAREKAEAEKRAEELSSRLEALERSRQETPEGMPSDAEILQAFGYDPEDPDSLRLLPLLKQNLALSTQFEEQKRQVAEMAEQQAAFETLANWEVELTKCENDYGKLSDINLTQEDVMEYAAEKGIQDPTAAYRAIAFDVFRQAEVATAKERKERVEAAKQQAAGAIRPSSQQASGQPEFKGKSIKDKVLEAGRFVAQQSGLSWERALTDSGVEIEE